MNNKLKKPWALTVIAVFFVILGVVEATNAQAAPKQGWVKEQTFWKYYKNDVPLMNQWVGDYYLKENGFMAEKEWIYDATYKSWYYILPDGKYAREQWVYDKGYQSWFYFHKYGKVYQDTWLKIGSEWYHFKKGGFMSQNTWVGNYYLSASGAMLTNAVTPDGYRVGSDGKWIPDSSAQGFNATAIQVKLVQLVNNERRKNQIPELTTSNKLTNYARIRATEMAQYGSLRFEGKAHYRPDGSKWDTVLTDVAEFNTFGENLVSLTGSHLNQMSSDEIAQNLFQSWMESDGHRMNMLDPDFNHIGFAVYKQGTFLVGTQIFAGN